MFLLLLSVTAALLVTAVRLAQVIHRRSTGDDEALVPWSSVDQEGKVAEDENPLLDSEASQRES